MSEPIHEEPAAEAAPIDFTQTPEFQLAVSQAVQRAVGPAVQAALAAVAPAANAALTPDMTALFEGFALAVSKLTDQGAGVQKPVPPELLRHREEGHNRCVELIEAARRDGRVASWRLISKVFLADQVIEPSWVNQRTHMYEPTDIDWDGWPSEAMEPLNETAKEIFAAYKQSIAGSKAAPVKRDEGFNIAGKLVIKGDPNRVVNGQLSPEQAKEAAEHDKQFGQFSEIVGRLNLHQQPGGGYEAKQILGTTTAGRALMTR